MMSLWEAWGLVFGGETKRVREEGLAAVERAKTRTDNAADDLIATLESISGRMRGKVNGIHRES